MPSNEFQDTESARTAEEAFRRLVAQAKFDHGHAGYTGTIAEKTSFRMEQPRKDETPNACFSRCVADRDHWSGDKWGPAACIDFGPDPKRKGFNIFYFFGWASL